VGADEHPEQWFGTQHERSEHNEASIAHDQSDYCESEQQLNRCPLADDRDDGGCALGIKVDRDDRTRSAVGANRCTSERATMLAR
jgi:hypothetical protein